MGNTVCCLCCACKCGNPQDYYKYKASGDQYFVKREYLKAIECYTTSIVLDGQHADAFALRAHSYYFTYQLDLAFNDFTSAIKLSKGSRESTDLYRTCLLARSALYLRMGKTATALLDLDALLTSIQAAEETEEGWRQSPLAAPLLHNVVVALQLNQRLDEAFQLLNREEQERLQAEAIHRERHATSFTDHVVSLKTSLSKVASSRAKLESKLAQQRSYPSIESTAPRLPRSPTRAHYLIPMSVNSEPTQQFRTDAIDRWMQGLVASTSEQVPES